MRITESKLRRIIRKLLKEASASQHGNDDTDFVLKMLKDKGYRFKRNKNFKGDFDKTPGLGYFIEPQNLEQEVIIRAAISCAKNFKGKLVREDKVKKTKIETPYLLRNLKQKKISTIGGALLKEGFVRICVRIPAKDPTKNIVYNKDSTEILKDDVVIYDIHMYFNPHTKQCVMPKFKLTKQIASIIEF